MNFPKFIPGYLFTWNVFHMATALLYWFYVVPPVETLRTLSWTWALWLCAVHAVAIFVIFGAVELIWHVKRKQGTRFEYKGKFPADQPSDLFRFKSQNIDEFPRSFFLSIPLWTRVEVIFLCAFAKGYVPWASWSDYPWYLAALVLRIVKEAKTRGLVVIFITHQVRHAMAVGDHCAALIRGAVAADFRKGEKTREEITDLMAGSASMAAPEAEIAASAGSGPFHWPGPTLKGAPMPQWIHACAKDDIEPDEMIRFEHGAQIFVIIR